MILFSSFCRPQKKKKKNHNEGKNLFVQKCKLGEKLCIYLSGFVWE